MYFLSEVFPTLHLESAAPIEDSLQNSMIQVQLWENSDVYGRAAVTDLTGLTQVISRSDVRADPVGSQNQPAAVCPIASAPKAIGNAVPL